MKSLPRVIAIGLLLAAGAVEAQDVTGLWNLTASFNVASRDVKTTCEYAGDGVSLTQMGPDVTGSVSLDLTSGDTMVCPGSMSGSLMATVNDGAFTGTLDGGKTLGEASVTGMVSSTTKGLAALSLSGNSSVNSGPFMSSTGTFSGSLAPVVSAIGLPALFALAALLLGGSSLLLMRRGA